MERKVRGRIVLGERTLYGSEKKINLRPQERRLIFFSELRPVSDHDGPAEHHGGGAGK